jgi:hypothetical protein
MARQIRIDALATECGVAPREVLKALIELGHFRYTRFNQQITEDLAQQVRSVLGPPEPPAGAAAGQPAEVDLFAQAMRAAGVERLDGRGGGVKSKGRSRAAPKSRPKPHARAQRKASPPPTPDSDTPTPAPEPSGAESAPSESAAAEEPALSGPPADAAPVTPVGGEPAGLEALEAQLTELREQRERLMVDLRALGQERDRLRQELDELVASNQQRSIEGGEHGEIVLELLQQRGLRGLDEAGLALRVLLGAHLLDGTLPTLRTPDGARLRRLLSERLCLCCGAEACGTPEGAEAVRVPAQRCELCGGEDLPRIHHRFSDACLLSGVTRVLVLGGRRWQHRWIEQGADRRLQLRLRGGAQMPPAEAMRDDLAWAQLVLLWDDGALHPVLPEAVAGSTTVTTDAGQTGSMMAQAVDLIEGLDPSELP